MDLFKQSSCIGILGGSFNPFHQGHIMMAKSVMDSITDIEKVIILPNNIPAYKKQEYIPSKEDRIAIIRESLTDVSDVYVSDLELKRVGVTYTVDTLRQIQKINPDLKIYFIIGADSLFDFKKWKEYKEVLRLCSLVVYQRNSKLEHTRKFANDLICELGYGCITVLDSKNIDVSSTKIRKYLKQGTYPYDMLKESALNYIIERKLYGVGINEQK